MRDAEAGDADLELKRIGLAYGGGEGGIAGSVAAGSISATRDSACASGRVAANSTGSGLR